MKTLSILVSLVALAVAPLAPAQNSTKFATTPITSTAFPSSQLTNVARVNSSSASLAAGKVACDPGGTVGLLITGYGATSGTTNNLTVVVAGLINGSLAPYWTAKTFTISVEGTNRFELWTNWSTELTPELHLWKVTTVNSGITNASAFWVKGRY